MNTSLHAAVILVFGNAYYILVISNICGRKTRFSASSQSSVSEKSTFGHKVFPRRECLFPVSTFKEENFNEKMSFLAGLVKIFYFPAKVPILAIFGYLGPPSKSIFSTYRQNFKKSSVCLLGEVVRNIVLNFQLSIFKKMLRGGLANLQVAIFQNP